MYRWLKLWDDTQIHLKTLSHHLLFRRSRVEQMRPYLDRAAAIFIAYSTLQLIEKYTVSKLIMYFIMLVLDGRWPTLMDETC
jgi:hypothetical protein